jgi:hypothetical protein
MGKTGSVSGIKLLRDEASLTSYLMAKLKMSGELLPFPLLDFIAWHLAKHRNKFTFLALPIRVHATLSRM